MRNLLFLVAGMGVVIALGFWLAGSMVPSVEQPTPESGSAAPLWLLTAIAWGTAFLSRPRWVCWLLTVGVIFVGGVLIVLGGLSGYWDSHMRGSGDQGWTTFWVGVLMLGSRLVPLLRAWAQSVEGDAT